MSKQKPFGNIPYTQGSYAGVGYGQCYGQQQQQAAMPPLLAKPAHQQRSKNYPFPTTRQHNTGSRPLFASRLCFFICFYR
jgi:hypothetical protein